MCYLLTISLFGMQTANKNPLKRLCFSGFPNLSFSKGGATRKRLLLVAKSGVYQRLMSNFYLVVCTLFAQLA